MQLGKLKSLQIYILNYNKRKTSRHVTSIMNLNKRCQHMNGFLIKIKINKLRNTVHNKYYKWILGSIKSVLKGSFHNL